MIVLFLLSSYEHYVTYTIALAEILNAEVIFSCN